MEVEAKEEVNKERTPQKVQEQKRQPKRKLSPLLEREERELLWNNALGHSLDSKKVVSALGFLDLK